MNIDIIKSIAFEVGIIAISLFASFIIPGLGGLIVSGITQFLGDLGIQLLGAGIPKDPQWWILEFLAVFGPYFSELKFAKTESSLLRFLEKGVKKVDNVLTKIDDVVISSVEYLKKKASYQFNKKSGFTQIIENEIRQVEQQELARSKFGLDKTKITKKINSFSPNTKNPNSWIAGVGFQEKVRLGPRDIRGDLIITYYVNNDKRVGYVLKPISKIVLGRTSGGEKKESNKKRYKKQIISKDPSKVGIRKVIFKGARYYNDYLAFLKSFSWGGYYMRRWMVGVPGKKEGINALILFGSIQRVWSKLQSLQGDFLSTLKNPLDYVKSKSQDVFNSTRFGSQYNKVYGIFSKGKSIKENPFIESKNFFIEKSKNYREKNRQINLKRKKRR